MTSDLAGIVQVLVDDSSPPDSCTVTGTAFAFLILQMEALKMIPLIPSDQNVTFCCIDAAVPAPMGITVPSHPWPGRGCVVAGW